MGISIGIPMRIPMGIPRRVPMVIPVGIPMGIDPAPQMANLYLYMYEAAFMEKLAKEDYGSAKKFNLTKRFIDDLNTINNDGKLGEYHSEGRIYPPEMQLNRENPDDQKATFLDMEEQIKDGIILTKTYDKREDFKFEIVNYPDLSGNIPQNAAYGVYTSQIIRNARVCCDQKDFLCRVKQLQKKLIKKGFIPERMNRTAGICLHRNPWIRQKYGGLKTSDLYNLYR